MLTTSTVDFIDFKLPDIQPNSSISNKVLRSLQDDKELHRNIFNSGMQDREWKCETHHQLNRKTIENRDTKPECELETESEMKQELGSDSGNESDRKVTKESQFTRKDAFKVTEGKTSNLTSSANIQSNSVNNTTSIHSIHSENETQNINQSISKKQNSSQDSLGSMHRLMSRLSKMKANPAIHKILKRLNTPESSSKLKEMGLVLDESLDTLDLDTFTSSFNVEKYFTLSNDNPSVQSEFSPSTRDTIFDLGNPVENTQLTVEKPAHAKEVTKIAGTDGNFFDENVSKELTVKNVTFSSIENPPIKILYDKLADSATKNIVIPPGPYEGDLRTLFTEKFLKQENLEIVEGLFWFVFCAFFQPETLPCFTSKGGLIDIISQKLTSFFWKTPSKLRNSFFDIYPHAVSYCIIKALKFHFPGSKRSIFTKNFFIRVQQLILELCTGVCFRESYIFRHSKQLFPGKSKDIMNAVIRAKKEKNYYSSDEDSSSSLSISSRNETENAKWKPHSKILKGKKKSVKQTLSEFISYPPDIKGDIDSICNIADQELIPPDSNLPSIQSRRTSNQRSRPKPLFISQSKSNFHSTNMRNSSLSPIFKAAKSFTGNSFLNTTEIRTTQVSAATENDYKFDNEVTTNQNVKLQVQDDEHTTPNKPMDLNNRKNKLKIGLKFVTNVNAAKKRLQNDNQRSKLLKSHSPRLDSPYFLQSMDEIRKRSRQLNSDPVAFKSTSATMTTMCMSPLISMNIDPPMEFSVPGKKRHINLDQGNSNNTRYFFQPLDKKKWQLQTMKHHNLWIFPDSKLRFKYSLLRQRKQLEEIENVSLRSMGELHRIEENRRSALDTLEREHQLMLTDPSGEILREQCKHLVDVTLGISGYIPGPRGLGAQEHYRQSRRLQPIRSSEIRNGSNNESMSKNRIPGIQMKGASVALNAINYSDTFRDELNQFEKRIDSISKKAKYNSSTK